jgi:hypothetical protein
MEDETQELRIAALLDAADAEQARVREAITDLEAVGRTLQQEIRSVAVSSMREALKDLQGDIHQARGVVRDLQRLSLWRAAWQHVWVALVAIAVTLIAVWWYVPRVSEMKDLRAERAQLQASIEDLSRRGGRIVMNTCGGRLCIEASTDQGKSYIDWQGAWHAHGVPLVIPKGY